MDVMASVVAVLTDAAAIFAGLMAATWIRFDSGLLAYDSLPPRGMYVWGAAIATILFLFIYRTLGLYVRPQIGDFSGRIPRLVRATGLGLLLATALAFTIRTDPPFSRLTMGISGFTILLFVIVERMVLFRLELGHARRSGVRNRVLIVGTDAVAARLKRSLESEPRLRSRVVGCLSVGSAPDAGIPPELIRGGAHDLESILESGVADKVILTDSSLGHPRIVEMILACERNMITFNMVPDMFRIMTGDMDMQVVDDIPLLGVSRWPLDYFWNRLCKRSEDIVGALVGLILTAPVIALAAYLVRRSSPGPAFYRQDRCGEKGRAFTIYKLRTMREDAEGETGPVWTRENDPRRTRLGAFLRRCNIDELPQLWNVLRGDMSLVGPRPERPHFVEKFKDDISRYMWRHVSKPGMTGWAQVNGLRGNTSIEERIKYDLYYLENWSLSFDFKILLRTFRARQNAY
jgi:exopolysaccharide biosynthesis polyprenyl glycosylphosphotransferase